jgi:5-dehydro-2-deoxygluconokinase
VAFEAGGNLGLRLRAWPSEHIAKCLVVFHPDDRDSLKETQIAQMRLLAEACAATGREMLLEVIAPARATDDALATARALDAIYGGGVKPDWWKLPPSADPAAWLAIERSIERGDPHCRGVLVLGMEAGTEKLRESFAAAARNPRVRGFAVGRSIFAPAAENWFAGRWTDARVVDEVAARYEDVIALWDGADRASAKSPRRKQKENA